VHQATGRRGYEGVPKNTRETARALRPSVVVVVVAVQKAVLRVVVRKNHRLRQGTAGVEVGDTRYIGDCAREMRYVSAEMKPRIREEGECSSVARSVCGGVHIYTYIRLWVE
jgi:hypothetical protein